MSLLETGSGVTEPWRVLFAQNLCSAPSWLASKRFTDPDFDLSYSGFKMYQMVCDDVDPETPRMSDIDSWERAETLRLARKHGFDKVRGHMWTKPDLTEEEQFFFKMDMRDRFEVCRNCGEDGHKISNCPKYQ